MDEEYALLHAIYRQGKEGIPYWDVVNLLTTQKGITYWKEVWPDRRRQMAIRQRLLNEGKIRRCYRLNEIPVNLLLLTPRGMDRLWELTGATPRSPGFSWIT
jgi:hypothetical protein